nr:hypothetical protein [Actinokineospora pegani]
MPSGIVLDDEARRGVLGASGGQDDVIGIARLLLSESVPTLSCDRLTLRFLACLVNSPATTVSTADSNGGSICLEESGKCLAELLPIVEFTGSVVDLCGDRGELGEIVGDLQPLSRYFRTMRLRSSLSPRSQDECGWAKNIGNPVAVTSACRAISEPQSHINERLTVAGRSLAATMIAWGTVNESRPVNGTRFRDLLVRSTRVATAVLPPLSITISPFEWSSTTRPSTSSGVVV